MKGLNKLALAVAISAAPFAQAMESLDDAMLGEMTGQAGVTIELDTAVTIASMTYTDTDGQDSAAAGTVVMNNIAFGGSTVAGGASIGADARFDDIKIDIDVDGTDGIIIHLIGTDTMNALVGVNPVDFGLTVGSVSSNALGGDIASNIAIAGNLGPVDIVIDGDGVDAANDLINVKAYFEVTSGSLDVDVIGLGITDLKIGQNSSPILAASSDYRAEIQGVGAIAGSLSANAATITGAGDLAANNYAVSLGYADEAALDAAAVPAELATRDAYRAAGEETATVSIMKQTIDGAPEAMGAPAGTNALANVNNVNNMAFVEMSIGNAQTSYYDLAAGATVTVDNVLTVDLASFNIDVSMGLTMGSIAGVGQSIGTIALDDLDMSGTKLKIYGH